MQTYKLSVEHIRKSCRLMRLWTNSLGGLIILFILSGSTDNHAKYSPEVMIGTYSFVVVSFIVIQYFGIQKYATELRSYRVNINNDNGTITITRKGLKDVSIVATNLVEIRHNTKFGILIYPEHQQPVVISSGLENHAALLETLSRYSEIKPFAPSWPSIVFQLLLPVGLLVGFIWQLRSMNWLITLTGTVIYGILAAIVAWDVLKDQNQSKGARLYGAVIIVGMTWSLLIMKLFMILDPTLVRN
jgi:hypothetical protein